MTSKDTMDVCFLRGRVQGIAQQLEEIRKKYDSTLTKLTTAQRKSKEAQEMAKSLRALTEAIAQLNEAEKAMGVSVDNA